MSTEQCPINGISKFLPPIVITMAKVLKIDSKVVDGEFGVLKDTVWDLSSRVMLLESFIKKQFGTMFLTFCEEQVSEAHPLSTGSESPRSDSYCNDSSSSQSQTSVKSEKSEKVLPLPAMVPISAQNATASRKNSASPTPNSTTNHGSSTTRSNKTIPPPPPLACIKSASANSHVKSEPVSSSTSYLHKPRNFLPKSLAARPKLFPGNGGSTSNSVTPGSANSKSGNAVSILKDSILAANDDLGSNKCNSEASDGFKTIKSDPIKHFQSRKLAAPMNLNKNIRISSVSSLPKVSGAGAKLAMFTNNFNDLEYYRGDSENDEELDEYNDGYLPSELVAAQLSSPTESKKMRFSFGSSSSGLINGSTPRQMRPNPCHTRCQNRCHDIWTDGDRMGVFQTYWNIPTEEERREFVAQRIERVDMATKRTEFSNFRTCTFKYYLPHPDNPWVQVCKNFFLATIDEKRSYIEKIAQSVKGETEKVSAKDIPFRRRNQMQRAVGVLDNIDYVGWMGLGVDSSEFGDIENALDEDEDSGGNGIELMDDVSTE